MFQREQVLFKLFDDVEFFDDSSGRSLCSEDIVSDPIRIQACNGRIWISEIVFMLASFSSTEFAKKSAFLVKWLEHDSRKISLREGLGIRKVPFFGFLERRKLIGRFGKVSMGRERNLGMKMRHRIE